MEAGIAGLAEGETVASGDTVIDGLETGSGIGSGDVARMGGATASDGFVVGMTRLEVEGCVAVAVAASAGTSGACLIA